MSHKLFKNLLLTSTTIAAGIASIHYKHKIDSQKGIDLVVEQLGLNKELVSSWTEPLYQKVNISGRNKLCLVGGLNVMEDSDIEQYHFLIDTFTGAIIDLKKVN